LTTSVESPGTRPLLEVKGAVVAYGRQVVLEGVDITVRPGDGVALIGPNGAGKSTLLKAILGLLSLSGGTVSVLGGPPDHARSRVAYVPQEDALDPEFPVTVLQVVLMGRYRRIGWGRRPSAVDRARALAALDEVRLAPVAQHRFGTLSGGQRQRVLLARAVAQEAKLLLLDEPFNGLDATTTDILIEVLARLRSEGAGVIMSTHDLAVAHLTCDEACLLNRHQIACGPIGETLTPERLAETYGNRAVVLANGASLITTVPTGDPSPRP
jgi:manganese/iron transport system ATP-binding protein